MRGNELLDKMELIAPKYIEEAEEEPKGKPQKMRHTWKQWAVLAACLLLVVGGALSVAATNGKLFTAPRQDWVGENGITLTEAGVTIPEGRLPESGLGSGMLGRIERFLIYEGRYYELYEYVYEGDELLGEYLGTPQELKYQEEPEKDVLYCKGWLSDNVYVYTVKGYDPVFMLCSKYTVANAIDRVSLYICRTGMTLKYGSELFEDRLHLSENCVSMQYRETKIMESGYVNQAHKDTYQLPVTNKKVKAFLKELNKAEVLPWDMVEKQEGMENWYDMHHFEEKTHVQFQMKDGTTVTLAVDNKGYVQFLGMPFVCVKLSEKGFESLLKITEQKDAVIVAEPE